MTDESDQSGVPSAPPGILPPLKTSIAVVDAPAGRAHHRVMRAARGGRQGTGGMRQLFMGAVLAALLAGGAAPASAQDASKSATYGEIRLSAGFSPDPYRVDVTAGGSIDAYADTPLPAACVGKVADAPDFEVTYEAGRLPLVFRTLSEVDTTLIINGPDGRWHCDDDSYSTGEGDAEVRFEKPRSGTYDVWIGTFGEGMASATLLITETP